MDTHDLRYGFRRLVRRPGFTAVAVLTLAVGIGANTAIFSFVDTILLRPLPFAEPDRLVMVWEDWSARGGPVDEWTSPADFHDMRERNRVLEGLAAFTGAAVTLTGAGEPERLDAAQVSPGFFPILGVRPVLGRTFLPEEEHPSSERVALLTHGLWQRRFGGDPDVVGRAVTLDGNPTTIVGVLPEGFEFRFVGEAEVWQPFRFAPADPDQACRGCVFLRMVGRMKPGVMLETAQADLARVARELEREYPEVNTGESARVTRLDDEIVGPVRPALLTLLGAVGFLLLIACANVANLQLAQVAGRDGELAIRVALGAGRARLARQLVVESLVLAAVGGGLGILVGVWGVDLLRALVPAGTPRIGEVRVDLRVLAFAAALTGLTGLVFGLAPAWHVARRDVAGALRESGRGAGASRRQRRMRGALVVGELALALVLLVGAGLFINSFVRLRQVDVGFRTENLLTGSISLPTASYEATEVRPFYRRLMERLDALPGVRSAAAISTLPLGGNVTDISFTIEGRPEPAPGQAPAARYNIITPGYFRTAGIPLVRGRTFTERDRQDAPSVVVIDEAMARRYWPDEDPIGRLIQTGENAFEIVGIVGGVRHFGPDRGPRPSMYLAHEQFAARSMDLVVRTEGDPLRFAGALRAAVRELDPDLAVAGLLTMEQRMAQAVAEPRLYTALLGFFAAVALLLASLGIYGVISYSVAQRTREIGLRMALGADRGAVLRMVVRQALGLVAIGAGLGLLGAFGLSRMVSSLLFEVSPTDPKTFAAVVVVLGGVAFAASYLPARRAARVDPVIALRKE